jgi:hypothetical protein
VYLALYKGNLVAVKKSKIDKDSRKFTIREVDILKCFKNSQFLMNYITCYIAPERNDVICERLHGDLYYIIK